MLGCVPRAHWQTRGHIHTKGLLVSVGHLCILQGLFSEIQNLSTVNRKELQCQCDVMTLHRDGCLHRDVVTSYGDGCLQT